MPALASFAASDAGRVYAAVCDRYNVDPGAVFADDVEAFIMRVVMRSAEIRRTPATNDAPQNPEDAVEAAWAKAGAENRKAWLAGT